MQANPPEGNAPVDAWVSGFGWVPDDCGSLTAAYRLDCGYAPGFSSSSLPAEVDYFPFGIMDYVKCSTISGNMVDLRRRAIAKLMTSTSHKIEAEFWKGTLSKAAPTAPVGGNLYLSKSGSVTQLNSGTAIPMVYAFAMLVDALADCAQGSRGMIHMTTYAALMLVSQYAIRVENGLLLDPVGNIIVAGSGYDGSSPAGVVDATGDTQWMYATDMVDVRLTPAKAQPWTDPTNNINYQLATREAAVTTGGCCLIGVNADLCQPFCSPG
jgi:hypothetical protein